MEEIRQVEKAKAIKKKKEEEGKGERKDVIVF